MSINVKMNKKLDYKLGYNQNNEISDKLHNGVTIISQVKIDTDGNLLLLGYSSYLVKVAVSCLVSPIDGDRVCAIVDGNNLYITSIIAREDQKDLTIDLQNSNISMLVNNIEFKINNNFSINTKRFALFSDRTDWNANISYYKYNKVYISSATYSNSIENTYEVYSKNIIFKATQSYTLRSKIGVLTSAAMLKLDGGQIHMG